MTEYDVTISSKGQLVLPKEIRERFRLGMGSKIKVIVDGERIILKPRTISDELQDLILADIAKDGKPVNEETLREYQMKLNKALDSLVAEGEREYKAKQYLTLSDLRKEEDNV